MRAQTKATAKLTALSATQNAAMIATVGATGVLFYNDGFNLLIGTDPTPTKVVASAAILAAGCGAVVSDTLNTLLADTRARWCRQADAPEDSRTGLRPVLPGYTVTWPTRPYGFRTVKVWARSPEAAVAKATSGRRLEWLNRTTAHGYEVAFDLMPEVWKVGPRRAVRVAGPAYSETVDPEQTAVDHAAVWQLADRGCGPDHIAVSLAMPLEQVRGHLWTVPVDGWCPRWTARQLIALHTRNAELADGPDATRVVAEETELARQAADGTHPLIGQPRPETRPVADWPDTTVA
ncbi:hypothetical protein [Streptomyces mangrovi]|uniref:hypothetical protein n=1 Tax=Streptomyces mangrovi TaxID=1206892 RepID=UPI00399D1686